MTVAVSRAKGRGAEAVICASTGNTAASAAAYAARAGLRGAVIVPEGKIAIGKLAQALMHGARVIALQGNFDDALRIVRELAQKHPIELVNSVNPHRIEGQKTAAFEVVEELGEAPGRAGDPGRQRRQRDRLLARLPGARRRRPSSTASRPRARRRWSRGAPVANPETVASAIRIGNPARWEEAMAAFTASRGRVAAVSDEQILDAYRWLAASEGVFCEPASAASVAGLLAHGLPTVEGGAPPGVGRLRPHRPRPQGPRHRARQGPRGGQLRERPQRGRAGGLRLTARHRLVRVPASSANLGPGYDVMAAAVSLHLELEVEETGEFSLRPGRARCPDRAREPDRAGVREPAPRRRDRLPAAQRDPAGARAGLQRGGDRRRALRRRPPLRAGALAGRSCWRGRPRSRATPTTSPPRSTAASSSAAPAGRGARWRPASTRPRASRGSP